MQLLRADRGRCRFLPFALRAAPSKKTDLNAEQALQIRRDGNTASVENRPKKVISDSKRGLELALGQTPFVIPVSCSDSRVPPNCCSVAAWARCSSSATPTIPSTPRR